MKTVHITKNRFLDWYFEDGQDQEKVELRLDLANEIIDQLQKKGTASYSVEELFDRCNEEAIRVCYLQEALNYDNQDLELSDAEKEFEVILID